MSKNTSIYQTWIDCAYKEFAEEGPNFSLKALANKANLPRATFYYHFEGKQDLISELLAYHHQCAEAYFEVLRTKVNALVPDVYNSLFEFKTCLLFHHQLFKHKDIDTYYEVYKDINATSYIILLPQLKRHFQTETEDQLINFFSILTDTWYARLNTKNINVDTMIELALDILENTMGLYTDKKI
jgi:AcrR family transcriptional regulator